MGLDTTHDCWHGAYSAFSRWRERLAVAAGYGIIDYKDEIGLTFKNVALNWEDYPMERYEGIWPETPPDPLLVLIVHSDCDGYIYPEQAEPLANRLEELLPKLGDENGGGHVGIYKEKTEKFIKGLRKASNRNEKVGFH